MSVMEMRIHSVPMDGRHSQYRPRGLSGLYCSSRHQDRTRSRWPRCSYRRTTSRAGSGNGSRRNDGEPQQTIAGQTSSSHNSMLTLLCHAGLLLSAVSVLLWPSRLQPEISGVCMHRRVRRLGNPCPRDNTGGKDSLSRERAYGRA